MRKTENIINRTGINKTECKKNGHSKENKIPGVKCTPKIELYLSNFKGALHWWNGSLFFLIIILGITLGIFAGCKNIFVPEPPATPEAAGPGGGITVPLRLFTGSARSVMPGMEGLTWEITATSDGAKATVLGIYPDFMISFPFKGIWDFVVKGKSGTEPNTKEIFTGNTTLEITGSTVSISIPLSPGSGMGEGTGTIDLTMTVPTDVTKVMYKLDSDTEFTDLTPSNGSCSLNKAGVSAGPHTLSLYFLDERGTTLYMCTEAVNVWNGMTSSQWINTGNIGYITGNGEFELTDVIIDAFLNTMGSVVYVNDSVAVNAPATGSFFAPVNSVSTAVDILRKANEGNAQINGTIMVSEATTIEDEIDVNSGETLTVKGMGENASIKNTSGRVFNIASGGSLTLEENITLTGTNDTGNGGAVYVNGGTFTMESGSKITRSSAQNGGGVYVNGGEFEMTGTAVIQGNEATGGSSHACGGGVYVNGGDFTMNGSAVIQGNKATSTSSHACGGGVYVNGTGKFDMGDTATIQGNNASTTGTGSAAGGGGVYVNGGTFTLTGTAKIQGNTTTSTDPVSTPSGGGGVFVIAGGTFTMSGGTIGGTDANEADLGGGVYVGVNTDTREKGSFTIGGGTITGNTATQNGGGVYVAGGTFTMSDTASLQGNTATTHGGGVHILSGGTFTMNGGTIDGTIGGDDANTAEFGGGVFVSGGTFTMNDGTISGNTVAKSGGGVCVYKGIFTMNDGTIGGISEVGTDVFNYADVAGGGVYVGDGTFTMNGGIITGNESGGSGGGIYLDSTGGTVTLNNNSSISGNQAVQNGGGVYVLDGTFTVSGSSLTITGNTAHNVYLVSGNTITIGTEGLTGGTIGVTAENVPSGTAVPITDKDVTGADGIFSSDNTAYSIVKYNEAVYLSDAETKYEADSGTELGTFEAALAAVNGSTDGGTITLLKDIVASNAVFGASSDDIHPITFTGGTEMKPITLDLNGKTIDRGFTGRPRTNGSVIKIEGGTLRIKDSSAKNLDGTGGTGTITNGNTTGGGGGIHITSNSMGTAFGSLILESGKIWQNNAYESHGGGVYIAGGCDFTMMGGSIDDNIVSSASNHGGGVFVSGTFTMENGTITKNSSGQGNGGGVNIGSNGTFIMKGGTISDNNAGTTGGGVNLGAYGAPGATMILEGGTISDNTATVNGGGVGVSTGNFTMTGGTIGGTEPNTAKVGGGVYVDGTNSNFTMTGGTISGNTATQKGGGVYVSSIGSFTLGSSSAVSSPVISGNTKTDNSTNNVYLDDTILLIDGKLKKSVDSVNIGITMATPGEFTYGWGSSNLADITFFFSDDTERNVALSGSELSLNLVRVEGGNCTLNGTEVTLSSFWISPYEVT